MTTVAQKLIREMEKMSRALEEIPPSGSFTRKLLVLYLREKTGLGKQKIEALLDALAEFNQEIQKEMDVEEGEEP